GDLADHVGALGGPHGRQVSALLAAGVLVEHGDSDQRLAEPPLVHPAAGRCGGTGRVQPHVAPDPVLSAPADRSAALVAAGALGDHPEAVDAGLDRVAVGLLPGLGVPLAAADHIDLLG